jgi:hypothetical protein
MNIKFWLKAVVFSAFLGGINYSGTLLAKHLILGMILLIACTFCAGGMYGWELYPQDREAQ